MEVILPSNSKFNAKLMVTAGKVESDFDLGNENEALLEAIGGLRQMKAKVNGGGIPLNITAHTIILRKAK